MLPNINKLTESSCSVEKKDKICRSRGGESCAFDGAMIVLQPIADTAHIVHGPIACAGNSWESRGTLSSQGDLYRMGFTTDMSELDIIYGSDEKLYNAIIQAYHSVKPKAIFVYSTCVSGLTGEDIDSVCKKAEKSLDIRVIPVNSPGFVGPKNLGNRIAGEVLLDRVIGTGEPAYTTGYDINLIGEYNIAGDLWHIEPLLNGIGVRVLSRITGDSTFEEITYAHRAKLNLIVCSRALINIAREMERKYGIPYVEVSFFGKTEIAKALREVGKKLEAINPPAQQVQLRDKVDTIIAYEEAKLSEKLSSYAHLKGKKAVLYTGGVKSWSLISALRDLGIDIVAVGTKKSTFEDEEKMREILGKNAPLVEDVAAKNLLKLLKEGNADVLIAGGRNQYLATKEGFPFVDVNQERHIAYAGYDGLVNLAEQISNSIEFFDRQASNDDYSLPVSCKRIEGIKGGKNPEETAGCRSVERDVVINPLKHSPAIGAALAFQGIHNALPIMHGAQGCSFLGKVLLTKHFREPIALASTKLFTEDVVMGNDDTLTRVVAGFIEKNNPDIIGILSSGLSEVRGDDITGHIRGRSLDSSVSPKIGRTEESKLRPHIIHIPTPDYEGGLEAGYARAVEELINIADHSLFTVQGLEPVGKQVNVLVGSHLTPADVSELKEIIESFDLRPVVLPDLSALDGSRQGFSALAAGGTTVNEIKTMRLADFTLAIGISMEPAAKILMDRYGIEYKVFKSLSGIKDVDAFMETLSEISEKPIPQKYERQRRILVDGMRDAHFYYGGKNVCLALEPDLSVQTSRWLSEMGVNVRLSIIPESPASTVEIMAELIVEGDLFAADGKFDLLISNSHGEDAAKRLGVPLYQMGFPVYKSLVANSRVSIGYKGTQAVVNEVANILMTRGH